MAFESRRLFAVQGLVESDDFIFKFLHPLGMSKDLGVTNVELRNSINLNIVSHVQLVSRKLKSAWNP